MMLIFVCKQNVGLTAGIVGYKVHLSTVPRL